jgi:16S rRNA (adenine1518-N6/adenine1519-N6)-dimethyltransferase
VNHALSPQRHIDTLGDTMTRQPMGQHFLAHPGWQRKIFETLPHEPGCVWIEIGAGHGEMTRLLAPSSGRVIGIEADPRLAKSLGEQVRYCPEEWPGAEVFAGDALQADLGKLARGRFRVYGNLPYYITSPLLHHLFRWADQIDSIHVVLQWEVAARIVARPDRRAYGYLSVFCQFYVKPEIVKRIPPGAFRPAPRVNSALMRMTPRGERVKLTESLGSSAEEDFFEFVKRCFSQKRKTLRNNLRAALPDERIQQALEQCGLRPETRAEQLTLDQFAQLFLRLRAAQDTQPA